MSQSEGRCWSRRQRPGCRRLTVITYWLTPTASLVSVGDPGTVYQGKRAGEWALLMEEHPAYTAWELLPLRSPAAVPILEEIPRIRPVLRRK